MIAAIARIACCTLGIVVAFTLARPSGEAAPLRDHQGRAGSSSGAASLSGTVVTDSSAPAPVRRALVTLSGGSPLEERGAITDDTGAFSFSDLPAGRFVLTAERKAFVKSAYGARRPGGAGSPLTLVPGQRLTGVTIALVKGSVVTGTVSDAAGDPLAGAQVSVFKAGPLLSEEHSATTDDRGIYRVFGLEPGTYVVAVRPRLMLPTEIRGTSDAYVDAVLRQLAARHGRSTIALAVPGSPNGASPSSGDAAAALRTFTYAPIYYPGTPVVADAVGVTLGKGEERAGVDVAIAVVPTATVTGTVFFPENEPQRRPVELELTMVGSALRLAQNNRYLRAAPAADGTFKISAVTPGRYQIQARTAGGGVLLWGAADVTVAGEDVSNLSINLQRSKRLTGRVQFQGGRAATADATSRIRIVLTPVVDASGLAGTGASTEVRRDGTFDVVDVVPGTYRIAVDSPVISSGDYWMRSAIINDVDVLDFPLEVTAGTEVSAAVVTFTGRHTTLAGTLRTSPGAFIDGYTVVVFPADRRFWTPGSRRVRAVRPANDGPFTVSDLPAGDYLIAASDDVDADALTEPAFLDRLAAGAVRASIADGETTVQDISVGTPPVPR